MKKIVSIFIITALVMSLCACGSNAAPKASNRGGATPGKNEAAVKPSKENPREDVNRIIEDTFTAYDIVTAFVNTTQPNFHTDMELGMEVNASAEGIAINLPISLKVEADVANGNTHGFFTMSMAFMGMEEEQQAEMYIVQHDDYNDYYTYDYDEKYWTVTTDETEAGAMVKAVMLDPESFRNATASFDEQTRTYTVIQEFKDFMNANDSSDIISEFSDIMTDSFDVDSADMYFAWDATDVIYTFNSDYQLMEILLDDCSYECTTESEGTTVDMHLAMSMCYTYSDYGMITVSSVEVPANVIDSAVPSTTIDLTDPSAGLGGVIDPYDYDDYGDDLFGSYNGYTFSIGGTDWDYTFGSDGWIFEESPELYTFIPATSYKYPEAELLVFNEDRSQTTAYDIENYGFYSYKIDVSYVDGPYPDMTWNGVTFGDTATDVIYAYGEANSVYEGSMYTVYTYEFDSNHDLSFYLYPGEGVLAVEYSCFNF